MRGPVELGQFATLEQTRIPTSIQHVNRLRSVTIGVSPGDGHLFGDLQNSIQAVIGQIPMPQGYQVTYAAGASKAAALFGDLERAMGMAVLLMYMLMMMLFGSLTLPLAVLVSLPLALIGALGAMALAHSAFTLFSMLGVAVLLGLVGKNAILLVDRTARLRAAGVERTAALLEAGPSRLRPIPTSKPRRRGCWRGVGSARLMASWCASMSSARSPYTLLPLLGPLELRHSRRSASWRCW